MSYERIIKEVLDIFDTNKYEPLLIPRLNKKIDESCRILSDKQVFDLFSVICLEFYKRDTDFLPKLSKKF